jgi:hypothetical protein
MRFDVGDVVIIRNDITEGECYVEGQDEHGYVNGDMVAYAGSITTITDVVVNPTNCGYYIEADNGYWFWYDHLLEPANNISVEGFDSFMDMFL